MSYSNIRIGDLVAGGALLIADGHRMRNDELGSDGIPFVRGGDIGGDGSVNTKTMDHIRPEFLVRIRNKLSQPGDTVFITKGTVGRAGYLRPNQPSVVFSPQVALWRVLDRKQLSPRFIYYLVSSRVFQNALDGVKTHGAMAADYVSISLQHEFRFSFPDIRTQYSIAASLGALDDKIELNRRMNETLEAMAQAIFRDWFVDFGPTRRKVAGTTDPVAIMGGLVQVTARAAELAILFPDALGENGLPEGWEEKTLEKLAQQTTETVSPASYSSETFAHFSIPAYDSGQVPNQELGSSILSNKTIVPANAVLLSKLNPEIQRVWLVPDGAGHRRVCSTEFLVYTASEDSNRSYLYCLFNEPGFREMLKGMVTGTSKSHQRVSPRSLAQRYVICATPKLVTKFGELAEPLLSKTLQNRAQQQSLGAMRDLLLPKLMSGEIRLREAEALPEAAQ